MTDLIARRDGNRWSVETITPKAKEHFLEVGYFPSCPNIYEFGENYAFEAEFREGIWLENNQPTDLTISIEE